MLKAKAELLVEAFDRQGAHAVAVGDRDIGALGIDALVELDKKSKFPFLCANVMNEKGEPVFKPYVVLEAAGYQIGVLAVVTGGAEIGDKEKYQLAPHIEAADKAATELLSKGVDAIILLAHLDRRDSSKLVNEVKGINLVLGGQSMGSSRFLESLGDAWWVEPGQKGKFLNIITMHLSAKGSKRFVVREQATKLKGELKDLDARIERYVRLINGPARPGTRTQNKDRFKSVIKSLVKQREGLETQAAGLSEVSGDSPFLSFESIPLNKKMREDPDTATAVEEFEKKYPAGSGGAHRKRSTKAASGISREKLHRTVMMEGARRGKVKPSTLKKLDAASVPAPKKDEPKK